MTQENPNAFKHFFNSAHVSRMGKALTLAYSDFDQKRFLKLKNKLLTLEMKPRVLLIRDELVALLPPSYPQALQIILSAAREGSLKGFDLWPFTEFIQKQGLGETKLSLDALKELTILFTSEFAVRPFLKQDPKFTLSYLVAACEDEHASVRRWASEGSRPRLPWGERLHHFIQHPELTLPILEKLWRDPELYVRKSVANHLNDMAKDHPTLVIKVLSRWKKEAKKEERARLDWIIRHSLRTLIKSGHSGALKLIGVEPEPKIRFNNFRMNSQTYALNEKLSFSFQIESLIETQQKLVIDYIIHYQKASSQTSPKVFKLKTFVLAGSEKKRIEKSHHLKSVTTRKHYAGKHYLEIMINGKSFKKTPWHFKLA